MLQDYKGKVETTGLIPQMGSSFQAVPELQEVVTLMEQWQYKRALEVLNNRIANNTRLLDSLLLKGELLSLFDYNREAITVYETVLQYDAENVYALIPLLVQMQIVGSSKQESLPYLRRLQKAALHLYEKFIDTLQFIEKNKRKQDFPKSQSPLDLFCVFGYFLNEDGSMPAKLEERLQLTAELAQAHPQAQVLLSGGAVQNEHVEAIAMKQFLVAAGIQKERLVCLTRAKDTVGNVMEFMEYIAAKPALTICAVTSLEHLPRAWMALSTGLKEQQKEAQLFGAAPQTKSNPDVMQQEIKLSYQTIFRLAGLFEKKDIEKQL